MYKHKYELTKSGKNVVKNFLKECKEKREEILKLNKDTANFVDLPDEEDILIDIEAYEDEGEYYNRFPITDNEESDLIFLDYRKDYIEA